MRKRINLLISAIAFSIAILTLVGCIGDGNSPKRLTMTAVSYNDTTKVVSWSAVANAVEFELSLVGQGVDKDATITAKNNATNKYEYIVNEETSGLYIASVVAKGDGTNFRDSDAASINVNYTRPVETEQLTMSSLSYDAETKIVSWDEVPNAVGYSLRVGSSEKSASLITEAGNKMQYILSEATTGNYTVYVKALGNGIEYSDSTDQSISCAYVVIAERGIQFYLNYPGTDIVSEQPEVRQTVNGLITYIPTLANYVFNGWWSCDGVALGNRILTEQWNIDDLVDSNDLILYADWVDAKTQAGQLDAPRIVVTSTGITWDAIANAEGYQLRYLLSGNSTEVVEDIAKTATSWTFPSHYESGVHTVRLRATGDGYSTVNSAFTTRSYPHKILLSPVNLQVVNSYSEITWSTVKNAEDYDIYIDEVLHSESITTTRCVIGNLEAGMHTVRVVANRSGYISSSATLSFNKLTLKSPDNISGSYNENHDLVLSWDASINADSYDVVIGGKTLPRIYTNSIIITRAIVASAKALGGELTILIYAFDSGTDYTISVASVIDYKYIEYESYDGAISSPSISIYDLRIDLGDASKYGYSFKGWYLDDEFTDVAITSLTITEEYKLDSIKFYALFNPVLTLDQNEYTPGSITGGGDYSVGEEVEIKATTNDGHTFLGWFNGLAKVSDQLVYTFNMPAYPLTLTARWTTSPVTIEKNIGEAGSISGAEKTIIGEETTITAVTNGNYTWLGWFEGDTKVSDGDSLTYTFTVTDEVRTFTATWGDYSVLISSTLNGIESTLAGTVTGNGRVVAGTKVTITATTNTGYTWLGWFLDDELVSDEDSLTHTFDMPEASVSFEARWSDYSISIVRMVDDLESNYGGFIYGSGRTVAGLEAEVEATINNGYMFLGWYRDDILVSDPGSRFYVFEMPYESITLVAKWVLCPITFVKLVNGVSSNAGGTVTGVDRHVIGEEITIKAETNTGFTWLGWFEGNEMISVGDSLTYTFNISKDIRVFTAKWGDYSLTRVANINLDTSVSGPEGRIVAGTVCTVEAESNTTYPWLGWFIGDQKVSDNLSYTFSMPFNSIALVAKWDVTYIDENGVTQIIPGTAKILTEASNQTLTGWYLLTGSVSADFTLTVSGIAHIILEDGCNWTVNTGGIRLTEGNTLYIYAQSTGQNMGKLSVSGNGVNIGGRNGTNGADGQNGNSTSGGRGTDGESAGTLVINGGVITAGTIGGGNGGAGGRGGNNIYGGTGGRGGDGGNGGSAGTIIINNGRVTVTTISGGDGGMAGRSGEVSGDYGGTGGAGGNGGAGGDGGSITINGGTVTIQTLGKGGQGRDGQYGSDGNPAYIGGGVISRGGNGGHGGAGGNAGEVFINGGTITIAIGGGGKGGTGANGGYTPSGHFSNGGNGGNGGAGAVIIITGGTVNATIANGGTGGGRGTGTWGGTNGTVGTTGALATVLITGGSVVINDGLSVTNGDEEVSLYVIEIDEENTKKASVDGTVIGAEDYSFNDVSTDSDGKIYLWLPSSAIGLELEINEVSYILWLVQLEKNILEAGTTKGVAGFVIQDEEVAATAETNDGYTWLGWFDGTLKVSDELVYTFKAPDESVTLTAKWMVCPITIISKIDETVSTAGGTVSGIEKTIIGTQVTLTATSKDGYSWLGWFYGGVKVSTDYSLTYTFTLTDEAKEFTAQWTEYDVTINRELSGSTSTLAGSVTGIGRSEAGASKTVTATTNPGYSFLGWYKGTELVSSNASYTFEMPYADVTLVAKWDIYTFALVNSNTQAGTAVATIAAEYKMGNYVSSGYGITLTATIASGYTFLGWFRDSELTAESTDLVYVVEMPNANITMTAKWITCPVSIASRVNGALSTVAGTVGGLERTIYGEEVTVVATVVAGYNFLGWFNWEGLLSEELSYTFVLPTVTTVIEARWTEFTVNTVHDIFEAGTTQYTVPEGTYDRGYTVSFIMNYGSYGHDPNQVHTTQYVSLSKGLVQPTDPKLTTAVFAGWYTTPQTTGAMYNFTSTVTSDMNLYAKWVGTSLSFNYAGTVGRNTAVDVPGGTIGTRTIGFVALITGNVTFRVTYSSVGAQTRLYLYNADRSSTIRSASGNTASITHSVTAGTLYFIGVSANGSSYDSSMVIAFEGTVPPQGGKAQSGIYLGGGAVSVGTTMSITAVARNSYTFLGWYDGDDLLTTNTTYEFEMPEENVLYTAKWILYELTFDADGGDLYETYRVSFNLNGLSGTPPATQIITKDQKLSYSTFSRSGYWFAGWFETIDGSGQIFDFDKPVTKDTVLYAKWIVRGSEDFIQFNQAKANIAHNTTVKYYTFISLVTQSLEIGSYGLATGDVVFRLYKADKTTVLYTRDANGSGVGELFTYTVEGGQLYYLGVSSRTSSTTGNCGVYIAGTLMPAATGKSIALDTASIPAVLGQTFATPPVVGTREYYTFGGFFTEKNGQGTQYYSDTMVALKSCEFVGHLTLYAYWIGDTITATLDSDGGNQIDEQGIEYGKEYTLPIPLQEGYTFRGWYSMPAGSGVQYTDGDGKSLTTWSDVTNKTLYARWSVAASYQLTLDADGGVLPIEDQSVLVHPEFSYVLAIPTRVGYTFGGWYSEKDGLGTMYADENGLSIADWADSDHLMLYAKWTKNTYNVTLNLEHDDPVFTVTFHLNGGEGGAPAQQIVTKSTGLTYPTHPVRSGYVFAGWYATADGMGVMVDFNDPITADIVLYAKWIQPTAHTLVVQYRTYYDVSITGTVQYFPFFALVSETVSIWLDCNTGINGELRLYNANKVLLAQVNDRGAGFSENIRNAVTAGHLYYIGVVVSGTSGSGKIVIEEGTNLPSSGGKAQMTNKTITVTFDAAMPDIAIPIRAGYTFSGFYTEINGGGVQYYDGNMDSQRDWDVDSNDVTLYALWIEATD